MIALTPKLRLPAKYHGGKNYLARRIIAMIPQTKAFAEHYAGMMSVGMNLNPLPFHVANDIDPDLMNFWDRLKVATDDGLLGMIREQSYSESTFLQARQIGPDVSADSRALAYLIVKRMSRGAHGRDFAWSDRLRGKRRPGGPIPGDVNAWETMVAGLPRVVARLGSIELTCRDGLDSIRSTDETHGPDVVHYCDPPYLPSTRSQPRAYAREMTTDQHVELIALLRTVKGTVLLSGYRSPLYDSELHDWRRIDWSLPNHSGQGRAKQGRVESFWSNRSVS